ncbi:MAG TPA: exodeoxyribonuclease V subunit gamma [Solirubrobacteraceae bacterium]|nr:exodeoxyribonuclease V subunit gamma [Solirubrobacteraceae bacterium]
MLHIHRAERADRLVQALALLLREPPEDPFTPDVIAVPTRGMERWLTQQLAAWLGSSPGRSDGVCANVEFPFPGRLIGGAVAIASGIDPDDDPWPPERSVWPLLDVVAECRDEPWLAQLSSHLSAASSDHARRFGRLRMIADLYDHYGVRRPAMLQAWASGEDVDGSSRPLEPTFAWQAELWRRLRAAIGMRSPAERLSDACARVREAPEIVPLPTRLSLFGLTRLPASYLEALSALSAGRDVHLFLLHPSPALWATIAARDHRRPIVRRVDDHTAALAHNRLLASWGVDSRELQLVVESAEPWVDHHHALGPERPDTLLGRVQDDIRANTQPPGEPLPGQPERRLALDGRDRTIEVHACHGPARQVEVLREAILHLLADDEALEPRDVIVMCPDIETYAPLIQATFGPIELDDAVDQAHRTDLRVRLADRSLRQTNPVLGVVARLIDLAEQRLTASQMLDLAGAEPVRRRFRFDDDDISRIQDWIVDSGIRWGLDSAHRAEYKLDGVPAGTWRTGVQRVLLGVAMGDSGRELYAGVLPVDDVESGAIDLAGRFAEFVDRVGVALDVLRGPLSIARWAEALGDAADALTATSDRDAWQRYELRGMLAEIVSESGDAAARTVIELPEIRALLRHRLAGRPTRANFRTGSLTVCTLVPMRSVPHRVVCLLGLDDGAFPRKSPRDGDDLLLDSPHVGDRDPRAEDRQMLLDALLAAQDRLIVLYSGHDERTNAPLPPAVPVGELLDAVDRTAFLEGGLARDRIVVHHPLQAFDPRNFDAASPWGFDDSSLEGAIALSGERRPPAPFLPSQLPDLSPARVSLDDLLAFSERPIRAFLRQRLGISVSDADDELADGLPVDLDGLELWQIGQRLLDGVLAGYEPNACIRAEIARGSLPPGKLGIPVVKRVRPTVDRVAACARMFADAEPRSIGVNVGLADGRALLGSVSGVRGTVLLSASYSRVNARHRIAAWVRLLALSAAVPGGGFEAVTVGKAPYGSDAELLVARIPPVRFEDAVAELGRLAELRDRGLRDVLPLPPLTAAAYARAAARGEDADAAAGRAWTSGFKVPGEDVDPDHVRAFGGVLTLAELLALPLRADEADQVGGAAAFGVPRLALYASRLWDRLLAVEELSEQ